MVHDNPDKDQDWRVLEVRKPNSQKTWFDPVKLDDLEKEIKTVPVDGEGRTLPVQYDEHYVRGTILKLIADLRYTQEEAAKQKFRFEYTEDLVKKAHTELMNLKKVE